MVTCTITISLDPEEVEELATTMIDIIQKQVIPLISDGVDQRELLGPQGQVIGSVIVSDFI